MVRNVTFFLFVLLSFCSAVYPAVILWDVGNTLVYPDSKAAVKNLGICTLARGFAEFKYQNLLHPLNFDFGSYLQNQVFVANLALVPSPVANRHQDPALSLIPGGKPMPLIMFDNMIGALSCQDTLAIINQWADAHTFYSANQKNLFLGMAHFCFDPQQYTASLCPLPCVDVLRKCTLQKNENGTRKNLNIIVSNWSREWIDPFKENFNATIMPYVDACVFSGEIGYAKPGKEIFEYCHNLVKNRYPKHMREPWFFIDDQPENLAAAKETLGDNVYGMIPDIAHCILCMCHVID